MIEYSVRKNKLVVTKGDCKQVIPIYRSNPFEVCDNFKILNLYLNLPVEGLYTDVLQREIPEGSVSSTVYKSVPSSERCEFLSFVTCQRTQDLQSSPSETDEAHQLSRIVSPRNELLQLYQGNYNYKISYRIINCSKCDSAVSFLYADFSRDDTSGAAYTLIDYKGNNIDPILVSEERKGCFTVNGWMSPILVKVKGKVKMTMKVTGVEGGAYPPVKELTFPMRTCLGTVYLSIYKNIVNSNIVSRSINPIFKGVNSIIRGYHFSDPTFPCFESTGNIIAPPPYFPQTEYKTRNKKTHFTLTELNQKPGEIYTVTSNLGLIKKLGNWRGIIYTFDESSLSPITAPVKFSGESLTGSTNMNIVGPVSKYEMTVKTIMGFSSRVPLNLTITGSMSSGSQFSPIEECECTFDSCPASWESYPDALGSKYVGESTFKFDTQKNKSFSFIFGAKERLDSDMIISDLCSLEVTIKYIGEGTCY